jgi:HSP20 family protein
MYNRRDPFGWTWRDFDEMMSEMENRFFGPSGRLLPPGGITDRMMPALRGEFRVDIRDHDDEIIVVADLPGSEKKDVSVSLVNPRVLEIRADRDAEKEENKEGYFMRERITGTMSRTVPLPQDVTDEGASATFTNGVLEIRMKKSPTKRGSAITVE